MTKTLAFLPQVAALTAYRALTADERGRLQSGEVAKVELSGGEVVDLVCVAAAPAFKCPKRDHLVRRLALRHEWGCPRCLRLWTGDALRVQKMRTLSERLEGETTEEAVCRVYGRASLGPEQRQALARYVRMLSEEGVRALSLCSNS